MNTEKMNAKEKLDFFAELYEKSRYAYADTLEKLNTHMRQYQGSKEIDGGREEALTVRNITYEIIESQVSTEIPQPRCAAECYSEERDRRSQAIEALCRSQRDKLPFEEMNDLDERFTYIYGGSVWLCEWDSSEVLADAKGGIKLSLISPGDFIPQPGVWSIDDMEYCFIKFSTTRDEVARKYDVSGEELFMLEDNTEGCDGESVTVILCFWRDDDGDVGKFIFSGTVTLLDLEKYYKRKTKVCKKCGSRESLCKCEGKRHFKMLDVDCEDVEDARTGKRLLDVPYYVPKRFPIVIRKNTSREKSLFGGSDCEYIRPEQQAINKIESRILQKLLRSGVTPIVPEDASITLNNSVFGQMIKMRPGESMAQYGTVDTTPDISQDIAEAERLYSHSKRILGITDAYQGIEDSKSESGYARQLKISQSSGRLESKKKMKQTAYAALDRMIFEHYLAFADEPRTLAYKDGFGRIHNASFNRYDFLVYDDTVGGFTYDDAYLFSVDLSGGAEYQREALWQRNLENLKAGTLGDPSSYETLLRYWQCQERAHYPHARENVEYFSDIVNKGGIL